MQKMFESIGASEPSLALEPWSLTLDLRLGPSLTYSTMVLKILLLVDNGASLDLHMWGRLKGLAELMPLRSQTVMAGDGKTDFLTPWRGCLRRGPYCLCGFPMGSSPTCPL